ncbi:MAG: DUF4469 domain-containing protein [Tannerellaceae bacterium]|jgi:hypothetical protein|nr:DUF4469 domain-containing protein [Tannerellaceae bacterium]
MIRKFLWKLWLRLNLMTLEVDDDYYAEVSTAGHTLRNEDIARRIVDEGSEIKYNTLFSIINQVDLIKREALLSGTSVQDGIAHFMPRVTGNWPGGIQHFDPANHRITLSITPVAELSKALAEEVEIEVLGIRDSGAYIGLVTDLSTGLADGTIVRGTNFAIEGIKVKIEPDDGKDETLGIFLIPEKTTDPTVHITSRLVENRAAKVVALLPAGMKEGKYNLRIVTRYSNGKTLLKEARTLDYPKPLNVVADSLIRTQVKNTQPETE